MVERLSPHLDGGISNGIDRKSVICGGLYIHHVHQELVEQVNETMPDEEIL